MQGVVESSEEKGRESRLESYPLFPMKWNFGTQCHGPAALNSATLLG